MKELLIKEKAKRYDETLKAAVVAHKDEDRHLKAALERIFPELKESEDEKIRKALIDYFDDANKADENPLQSYGIHTDKAIALLEKQGGQKPAEWSEEMGKLCLDAIELLRDYASGVDKNSQLGMKICRADAFLSDLYHDAFYPSTYNMREDLRKTEWSEEDELQMNAAIDICKNLGYTPTSDWLKSLKLRNHWKPTEEQVSTMKYLAKYYAKGCDEPTRSIIEGLYEQLKQL